MAEAKWLGVLSTTEPRNDVGIIKVRQGNINSEIAEFQIVQNNKPYDLTGLTVYFCASFGLNLVEKPAVVVNTTGGRIQYTFDDDSMQAVGRQKGYFSIKKEESKIDSTQDFEFRVESSLMTRSIDGKSYIYKLSTLIKVLDDFIKNGQNNFNTWFDSVKEILYGVDPGGNILRELIEARKNIVTYVSDNTVGNSIIANVPFSTDYLRKRQNLLLTNVYKNIRNGTPVKLCSLGDSTTYGHDTVSSNIRPANSDDTLDQSQTYAITQASISYPEAMQSYINEIGLPITVTNRGFSGDTAKSAYTRWVTPSGADLTFIMFGLNDFSGSLEEFREYYIRLISRELLRNSAVVILTPLKTQQPRPQIDSFTNVLFDLGNMLGVPVIKMDEMMDNYSVDIRSDDFHLNGDGYRMIGARLTSVLVGEGANLPNFIKSGDKLLTRQLTDNVIFSDVVYESNGAMDTPDEMYSGLGLSAKMSNKNSRVYYSFYSDEDDLIIVPDLFKSGISEVEVELNFDTIKPKHSLNVIMNGVNEDSSNGVITNFTTTSPSVFTKESLTGFSDKRYIHVVKKGWHILSIKKTAVDGTWWLRGLEVLSYEDYKKLFEKGYFAMDLGYGMSKTELDIRDIYGALNIVPINSTNTTDYYKSTPLSLTIYNHDNSIRQYMFNLANIGLSSNWEFSSTETVYALSGSSTSYRTLTGVSYNATTKKITFTWGNSIGLDGRAVIKIA